MKAIHSSPMTIEEYLAFEEKSVNKHEYIKGEIFAMAGASVNHGRICSNLIFALKSNLSKSDCEVFGSFGNIKVTQTKVTF